MISHSLKKVTQDPLDAFSFFKKKTLGAPRCFHILYKTLGRSRDCFTFFKKRHLEAPRFFTIKKTLAVSEIPLHSLKKVEAQGSLRLLCVLKKKTPGTPEILSGSLKENILNPLIFFKKNQGAPKTASHLKKKPLGIPEMLSHS